MPYWNGKTLRDINAFRAEMGVGPLVYKRRKCLRCGKEFSSQGAHNRCCNLCRYFMGLAEPNEE